MTVERKIIVGLEDIKAISFQCDACQYRVTMSPDEVKEIPKNCSNGHRWLAGEAEATVVPLVLKAVSMFAALRILVGQNVLGFRVLLEFDEPKAS
jgi:hypothetical protein